MEEKRREIVSKKAHNDTNIFCEAVLKDGVGNNIKQADIHRIIQNHIEWCKKNNRYAGIVAPWGHGKTEQVVISRTLQFLGQNPENRLKIVCNSDTNARQRVSAIRRYIESDDDYHGVFPGVMPKFRGSKGKTKLFEKWSDHELLIERKSPSKDNSVEAWGVFASAMGARCDILIIDDPADLKNSVLEPASRAKVIETLKSGWMSRLEPDGFMIYIATIWHEEDATNVLMKNEKFSFLWMAISEDFKSIKANLFNGDESHPLYKYPWNGDFFVIPLWKEKWSEEALRDRFKSLGSKDFNRGFRQIPFSDEDRMFPHFEGCIILGNPSAPKNWLHYGGMDLAGKNRAGTVIFTLAKSPDGVFHPVEVRMGQWEFSRAVNELYSAYEKYQHRTILVENNALQEMVVGAFRKIGKRPIPIRGYHTGKQKNDPQIGLPGLDVEFENKMWVVSTSPSHQIDCNCGMCRWVRSMKQYPYSSETDTVMACWFAREAARKSISQSKPIIIGKGKIGNWRAM